MSLLSYWINFDHEKLYFLGALMNSTWRLKLFILNDYYRLRASSLIILKDGKKTLFVRIGWLLLSLPLDNPAQRNECDWENRELIYVQWQLKMIAIYSVCQMVVGKWDYFFFIQSDETTQMPLHYFYFRITSSSMRLITTFYWCHLAL